ncbi:MAG: putative esterase [Bacteroidetes bacterium]|nr:putative esterase [Bacteroidota bacterium]
MKLLRGRQLIVGSLEYIYESPFKLFFDTYLKARYDLGAIWSSPEQIRIVDFMHGIGVGVAFDTPIGPAEFSLGRAFFFRKDILDNPLSLGPFIAYFSIGYSF